MADPRVSWVKESVIGWFGVIRYVEGTGVLNVRQWFSFYRHRSVVFHIVKAAKQSYDCCYSLLGDLDTPPSTWGQDFGSGS